VKSRPNKHGEPWSHDDVRKLRELAPYHPIGTIAIELQRTQASIASKAADENIHVGTDRVITLPSGM
jgi:hypothetical protein